MICSACGQWVANIFLFKLFYIFQTSVDTQVLFLRYNNKTNSFPRVKESSNAGLGVKETIQQNLSGCPSKSALRSCLPLPWLVAPMANLQHQVPSTVFNSSPAEFLACPCDLSLSVWQVPRPRSGHVYFCRLSTVEPQGLQFTLLTMCVTTSGVVQCTVHTTRHVRPA